MRVENIEEKSESANEFIVHLPVVFHYGYVRNMYPHSIHSENLTCGRTNLERKLRSDKTLKNRMKYWI